VAIGHKPNTDIFKDFITLDETGYIVNTPGSSKTNVEGVFVSGDAVIMYTVRQLLLLNGLWLL
jgi:thioredoxin reductase (NADPH)